MKRLILVPLVAVACLTGCFIGERGSGVSETQEREVDDFHSIAVAGSANVIVTVGTEKSVKVTFDDNLIDKGKTEVENGELSIYTSGSYSSSIGFNVEVGVPDLQSIAISGSADVLINGLEGGDLKLTVSGSGDAVARGTLDKLVASVSGSGDAELRDLIVKEADLSAAGSGDITVHVTTKVTAAASGSADISIFGNPPDVKESASGSADVNFEDS